MLGWFTVALAAARPAGAGPGERWVYRSAAIVPAAPADVFPLLCPIRENEWIPGWKGKVVHSVSGVAEAGGVFRTRLMLGETWVVSRYEPPWRVEYTIFAKHAVETFAIEVNELEPGRVEVRGVQTFTGLDRIGNLLLSRLDRSRRFERMVDRNLGLLVDRFAPGAG